MAHKGLIEAGFAPVLTETKRVTSAPKAAPFKTDRRDAEGIAPHLRKGWFRPVRCESVASREKRALPGARKALVEGLARLELSVRGILRSFGLRLGQLLKGRREERVRELTVDNATPSDAVEPILRLRAQMRGELATMSKRVRNPARSDATRGLLMTMPGAGPVTALTVVAAVDDPSRFRRARDTGAWATPKRSRSVARDVSGEIARQCDFHVGCRAWGTGSRDAGIRTGAMPAVNRDMRAQRWHDSILTPRAATGRSSRRGA